MKITGKISIKPKLLFLIVLFTGTLLLRLYKVDQGFPFDYDQEVPAVSAYNFFKFQKLSLIGQELSFQGFFLGPVYNWIEYIPYGLCRLSPSCVPYFHIVLSAIIIILLYLAIEQIVDKRVAIITSLFFSVSFMAIGFDRIVNSNFFLFLSSIILLFSLYKYFKFKDLFLTIGAFFAGLAVVNFNPVFIFSAIAFFIVALFRKKNNYKIFLVSFAVFILNYFPLLLFNFRHQNLLLVNFRHFIQSNTGISTSAFERAIFITKKIILPLYTSFFFHWSNYSLLVPVLILLLYGSIVIWKKGDVYLRFLPISIVVTFAGFTFYKGGIADYYFLPTLLPATILIALTLVKNKYLLIFFAGLSLFLNIKYAYIFSTPVNLKIKQDVVKYIHNDTEEKSFKLYNDMPRGFNTGYNYLFKLSGLEPRDDGENLYILNFSNPDFFNPENYYRAFRGKAIEVKTIGYVEIVSIK